MGEEGTRLELEEAFEKIGPVKNIWLAKNPPSFAFIEMEVCRKLSWPASSQIGFVVGSERC